MSNADNVISQAQQKQQRSHRKQLMKRHIWADCRKAAATGKAWLPTVDSCTRWTV